MKASELRIGNWLLFNDSLVTIIPQHLIMLSDSRHWFRAKPIPLTEKWLKDFGFVTPIQRHGVYIKGRLQIYGIMSYLIEEDTLRAHFIPNKLEYVHQLQNLYFALTGEELALDLAKQTDKK